MFKKLSAILIALLFLLSLAACGNKNTTETNNAAAVSDSSDTGATDSTNENSNQTSAPVDTSDMFSDSDSKDVTNETPDATITLSGNAGTLSDSARGTSGQTVTITQKGIYRVTGSSENVTIEVSDETKSGNVYLILDNVAMKNTDSPCILVSDSDKVILQCVGSSTLTAEYTDDTIKQDGAIYAKDDLTINGAGTLTVHSALHGVVCKNDLKITGSTLVIDAASIGMKAGDTVRIGGGTLSIDAGHDGIQITNDTAEGIFYISGGDLTVNAGYDGIDVTGSAVFDAGTLKLTAGGGADNAKDDNTSQKGVKCDGAITVTDAALTISAADDAIHSDDAVTINGGNVDAASSDDGIHADSTLTIGGGSVRISKSLEGLEAQAITISGGDTKVYASDDGLNAAGGSDTQSTESGPWGSDATGTLNISGGNLYVNSQGDGLDSNGSLYVTGGTVIVEGPTNSGNGALDIGERGAVAEITGGTVLALGSTGMAVNFNSGSQCAALVALSGNAGDTITVDDGTNFSFTAGKVFSCAVYSSPALQQGSTYTITSGSNTASLDFTSAQFYANIASMGGGFGGDMGGPGREFQGNPSGEMNGQRNFDFSGPPEGGFDQGQGRPEDFRGGTLNETDPNTAENIPAQDNTKTT